MTEDRTNQDVRTHVRDHYAQIASHFQPDKVTNCCGPVESDCCSKDASGLVKFYETAEVSELPDEVTGLSLGCGDPITLAALKPGQTVLDLGSGGGIDCFLAAQKVGSTGQVIGVDMTPIMLDKARANKEKMGLENVEFRLGEIENLPVGNETVDVIISNCVINLSPDKPRVFREAFRVLRSGGKLAVSDIVTDGPLPETIKSSLSAWAGCVAGALDVKDYIEAIEDAGFVDVTLTPVYLDPETVDQAVTDLGEVIDLSDVPDRTIHKTIFSAKITAYKP